MPIIAKVLLSLGLTFAAVEITGRLWLRAERRHYPDRGRIRAEKTAAGVTGAFALGVLLVSTWSQ